MTARLVVVPAGPAEPLPLPWIAGVLDTVGAFQVRDLPGGTRLPRVSVQTPSQDLAARLAGWTGVRATPIRRSFDRSPCSLHCDEPHVHVQSTSWRWTVTGAKATVVCAAAAPYMLLRRPDALELADVGVRAPLKAATAGKMRALGWPLPPAWEARQNPSSDTVVSRA